jgi:hypothetical protein
MPDRDMPAGRAASTWGRPSISVSTSASRQGPASQSSRTVVVLPRHARGLASGQVAWLEPGQTADLLARGDAAEVLGFELKAPPVATR